MPQFSSPLDATSTLSAEELGVIKECLQQFELAWETADAAGPDLLKLVGAEDRHPLALRRLLLVKLIQADMERRWATERIRKSLNDYCNEFPELKSITLPIELIYTEYACRQRVNDTVTIDEYLSQYPDRASELLAYIEQTEDAHGTVVPGGGPAHAVCDIHAGDIIDDFDLLVPLGRGTFASVFLARQISMQRLVAVKISKDEGVEPQTLAQLDHDYIVRVFDQRVIEQPQCRLLYMQYLPGGTLEAVIQRVRSTPIEKRTGQLLIDVLDETLEAKGEISPTDSSLRNELRAMDWPEVVAWLGIRLAKGLHYASQQGVLHRDLKPANVLLTSEGVPKIADFNTSFGSSVSGTSADESFGGSLAYMSPEQLEACLPGCPRSAEDLDVRTDLYSLGILLWELLTGERPFEEKTPEINLGTVDDLLKRRQAGLSDDKLDRLRTFCPECLIRVLVACLQPDREDRYTTPGQIVSHLQVCLEPRARNLIDASPKSWRRLGLKWIVTTVLLLNLIPNAFSAVANFIYNQKEIFEVLAPGKSFEILVGVINGVAFPIGISVVVLLARQVRDGIHHQTEASEPAKTREAALLLGHRCALICLLLWTIAGVAYPVAFQALGISVSIGDYLLIFGSLVLFGLIATAYPFFGITWYAVQFLYPAMLRHSGGMSEDCRSLGKLKRFISVYLAAAATIPLISVTAITIISRELIFLAQFICLGGMLAFWAAFWFYLQIQGDIEVFARLSDHQNES